MTTLAELFAAKGARPLVCLEVNPPRGTDTESIITRLQEGLSGIDFVNVTDSALARMKMAAIPFAATIKQRLQIEALVNVSCRDRNLIALQADLLAGWALGVRSVVALTGDAVTIGDSPDRKGVFEVNSVGLLQAIAQLNQGRDLAGNELKGTPRFVPGVVANPNARNLPAEIRRLRKKRDAGACYVLTQPVFDVAVAEQFIEAAGEVEIPILLGLLPLKNAQAAERISKVPGIRVSDGVMRHILAKGQGDLSEFFLSHCLEIADRTKGLVRGFHVVSGVTPLLALTLAQRLGALLRD